MTLNSNGLDQTQINSSNFVIIHNQRKKERSPPKKKKNKNKNVKIREMYVGVPLIDLVPTIMKLFKNFESRIELLNHAHKKKKKKRIVKKGRDKEWYNPMKNKKKSPRRVRWRPITYLTSGSLNQSFQLCLCEEVEA